MAATPSPGSVCPRWPRPAASLALALSVVLGAGCQDTVVVASPDLAFDPAPPPDFRGRTAYEIFLRSFADSDGDGIGDLKGLTAHLDDLNDGRAGSTTSLGVDAIWLTPVFPSPSYHGYDVTDYQSIKPEYGTLADFDAFLAAAHQRGIKVILDLVLNHSSSKHPWFVDAAAGPMAPKRDYYVWKDMDPNWGRPWDASDPWHPANGAFYYGLFSQGMPDLNVQNPAVEAALTEAAKFWLARGVDGFRLDAIRYLVENGNGQQADQPETHGFLKRLRTTVSAASPHAQMVGEVWTALEVQAKYYGGGDELSLTFSFDLADALIAGLKKGTAADVINVMARSERAFSDRAFEAPFLSNHDQVRVARAVAGDKAAERVAVAALMAMPGTPFLYYGEEIGMLGGAGNDDVNKRTPMRWTAATPGHGFTTGTPWTPAIEGDGIDVATQKADPGSLWNLYRQLITLRRQRPALQAGSATRATVAAADGAGSSVADSVLALVRDTGSERVLVVANFSSSAVGAFTVPVAASQVTLLLGEGLAAPVAAGSGMVSFKGLAARGFAFLVLS